jgi:hypothetical protein
MHAQFHQQTTSIYFIIFTTLVLMLSDKQKILCLVIVLCTPEECVI